MSAAPAAHMAPWWRGAVLYQLYPLTFADSNGDGVGDLPGIIARLDHVARLGVDAVWLSPFYPSPLDDFGYDVADYCAVDPRFGTLADFDALVARAHALGLKLLVDMVWSHTSAAHPWFTQSRADRTNARADWYVWADPKPDGSPPSNWQSVFGGPAWTWDARRGQYYLHNFLKSQPQLNGHNPAVQDALLDVARFWLNRGVDGFRIDAVNFLMHWPDLPDNPPLPAGTGGPRTRPFDFQQHLHNQSHPAILGFLERVRALMDAHPGRFALAEVGGQQARAEMLAFTAPGRLDSAYGFDFLYAPALTPALLREVLGHWNAAGEGYWPAWAFSNHDAPRAVSRWATPAGRDAMARQAMLLLLTLRGCPIMWQGEELGLPQAAVPFAALRDPEAIANWPLTLGRDGARTPMPWDAAAPAAGFSSGHPWLPVDPAHLPLAVSAQEADPRSMLAFTRRVVALRKAHPALAAGALALVGTPDPVVAFTRGAGGDALMCAFNLSDAPAAWALPEGWRVIFATDGEAVADGRAGLPPRAGLVAARA